MFDIYSHCLMNKLTNEELVKLLVANFTDEDGNLKLFALDFRGHGLKRIHFEHWQIDCDFLSRMHHIKGEVQQDGHRVGGDLYQQNQDVSGDIVQDRNYAKNLYQGSNEVRKNLYFKKDKVEGHKFDTTEW